jgi:HEAT repeat protein
LIAVGALATACAIIFGVRLMGPSAGATPSHVAETPGTAPSIPIASVPGAQVPTTDLVAARFILGTQRAYTLDVAHQMWVLVGTNKPTLDPGQLMRQPSEKPMLDLRITGIWTVTLVGGQGAMSRFRASLHDSKVSLFGQSAEVASALKADAESPFFYETNFDGIITSLYFGKSVGHITRGVLKSIVATTQVVHRPGREWTAAEQDTLGEYEARYTRRGDTNTLQKTRTKYLRLATAHGVMPADDVGSATLKDATTIAATQEGDLERLTSKLATDVKVGNDLARVRSRWVESMVFRDQSMNSSVVGDFDKIRAELDRVEMVAPVRVSIGDEEQRKFDQKVVGNATMGNIAEELAAIPIDAMGPRASGFAKFRADFRTHPEDLQKAVKLVETTPIEDGKTITAAMGAVRTPAAQRALVDIIDDRATNIDVRLNASMALALQHDPTRETFDALKRMGTSSDRDIRGASMIALGAVTRNLGASNPDVLNDGVATLIRDLQDATSPEERAICFNALGNAGDARVIPFAKAALTTDPSARVRRAAIDSVRLVEGKEVDDVIGNAMLRDAEPQVRKGAVETASASRFLPKYLAAYTSMLVHDQAALVRRAVVQSLVSLKTMPEAIALLTLAERDESEDVRRAAEAVLAMGDIR